MGLNLKKILALSGGIAATVSTGGVAAPILIPQVLNLASEFAPDGSKSNKELKRLAEEEARKANLDGWERVKIAEWVETYKRLMSRGVGNLDQVFQGYLQSQFIMNYADDPEEDWIEGVHEMVANAVRWQIATADV